MASFTHYRVKNEEQYGIFAGTVDVDTGSFIENLKKPYAGDHNDLMLSQDSSVSNEIDKVTPGSALI